MRRYSWLLLAGLVLLPAACSDGRRPTSPAAPSSPSASVEGRSSPIVVETRNMYLGADIGPLIAGGNPAVVLPAAVAQLTHTDYPARAQYLAMEIATHHPDAVGLQEVSHYTFNTAAGVQQLDFLDVLQQYLAAMGAQYDVAVRQNNVSLSLPLGGLNGITSLTYTDGDAILVRHGIPWSAPAAGHYTHQVTLSVAGQSFTNLRGWNAVNVTVGDVTFRFVNTHLEIQSFAAVQEAQAAELAAMLQDVTGPVILVGDFNSAANPGAPPESKTGSYRILRSSGFSDIELRAGAQNMLTCCHLADLSDTSLATFDQRLDLVFARFGHEGFGGRATVDRVGSLFTDPHGYTLWPSDHSGVVATLWPAPGLLAGD